MKGTFSEPQNRSLPLRTRAKRLAKSSLYYRAPAFIRPFLYFIQRYLLMGGFLDGKEGLAYHFLQSCWYRFLVDIRISELQSAQRACSTDHASHATEP